MANPVRTPRPRPESAPEADPEAGSPSPESRPQLRPRALREVPGETGGERPTSNEPLRLQERVAAAFTARTKTALEKTLMRLIIIAATCLVVLSAVGQGGVLSGLFR